MASEHWKDMPEAQDFPAAESYLSLLVGPEAASKLAKAFAQAAVAQKPRRQRHPAGRQPAAPRPAGPRSRRRPQQGQARRAAVTPVPLVQGEPLWVAGGYQRICASYHLDEKTEVQSLMERLNAEERVEVTAR